MLPQEQIQDRHRRHFEGFAKEACGDSVLYERLSRALATDETAVQLLSYAPPSQRRANLLFAAVHDLLLAGVEHPLARFYPSVGGQRLDADGVPGKREVGEVVTAFRDLLWIARERIIETIRHRRTQTNEVGRGAALWPALHEVARWAAGRPLALVEIGCSAGLLLHLDRYRYRSAAPNTDPGDGGSISSEVRGTPPRMTTPPVITQRTGIDLHPLDVSDDADVRWLRACVWPENLTRLARLDAAVEVARQHRDVRLLRGDVTQVLPSVLTDLPDNVVPCVFHSATLAYLDPQERDQVDGTLDSFGSRRDLARLSLEGRFLEPFASMADDATDEAAFLLGSTVWRDGSREDRLLARAHPHGAWVEHLAAP